MPARAKKRTETSARRVAARSRRSGRPRAATAASRIYSELRIELVSLQRRPGEAILKLSDEGLLEIYPQSGIFVSRIPIAALPEAIIIRKALEETTARLAAERATSSQILTLCSVLERQREANAARDSSAFHQADEMFHAAIADVAGYPGIWKFIQQVKVHVDRYRLLTLPQHGRIVKVIGEHEAILTAIEAHDPERARQAMESHLESLLDNISATQHGNPEYFDERL